MKIHCLTVFLLTFSSDIWLSLRLISYTYITYLSTQTSNSVLRASLCCHNGLLVRVLACTVWGSTLSSNPRLKDIYPPRRTKFQFNIIENFYWHLSDICNFHSDSSVIYQLPFNTDVLQVSRETYRSKDTSKGKMQQQVRHTHHVHMQHVGHQHQY